MTVYRLTLTIMLLAMGLTATVARAADVCTGKRGCDAKLCQIARQLAEARAHKNRHQVAGRERALAETRANCNDTSLRQQREQKADKARAEVAAREADLREAQVRGDAGKIAKRQRKLDAARADLKAAEAELDK